MTVQSLDHYLVFTGDLETTKKFYVDTLGLEVGFRPPFEFPGYWLYIDGHATVHLAGDDGTGNFEKYLDKPEAAPDGGTGALDHIAFRADNIADFRTKLEGLDVTYKHRVVPGFDLQQLFFDDPDGLMIELNFYD
jgi:catechol 2,3-dioxygenase-like lactoylglutathione lyase family enzyme